MPQCGSGNTLNVGGCRMGIDRMKTVHFIDRYNIIIWGKAPKII